jgi:uncharacterized iron-regulated membrane protein
MTDTPSERNWPDYRAVWRWHFYAGLFCIPFVIVLSISGGIYLFKPQIEAWNDAPYDGLTIGQAQPVAEQIRAAVAAFPESRFVSCELPKSSTAATRIIIRQNGESVRTYVHPETLETLHSVPDDQRFMRSMFRLHGELWMGNAGSNLVELAASWTIIMILTGLYLWWPRQSRGLGGVLYPRLRSGSRLFWRDLHSVAGIWISALTLFLLLSGLPWAKAWGGYFKAFRRMTGTDVARQDWTTGSERRSPIGPGSTGEHGEHGGRSRRGRSAAGPALPKDLEAVDRIVTSVRPLNLAPPVVIAPPEGEAPHWTAKSMAANRPLRVTLVVDGHSGSVVSREDFADRHLIDRIVGTCIAAHEGQLFGWPNQLLGLVAAGGLVLVSVSGVILWWRRREQGVLGAPRVLLDARVSWGLISLMLLLGIYLPLFGGSLLAVLLIEWALLRRIPGVRNWLGLPAPSATIPT